MFNSASISINFHFTYLQSFVQLKVSLIMLVSLHQEDLRNSETQESHFSHQDISNLASKPLL